MPWVTFDISKPDNLHLNEAQEAGLKAICAAYNYPYELLLTPQQSFDMSQYGNYPPPPHYTLSQLAMKDRHEHKFLEGVSGNWNNHLPLLLLGLHKSNGLVIEFGSGEGSTRRLRDYCNEHNRPFESWESNKEWAEKTGANYTSSWEIPSVYRKCGLFFCDHAPGEHRIVAIEKFANLADIIVIHDSEEGGAGDYKFEKIWHLFKYRLNYNKTGGGAGATMVSNKIDVNRFRGLKLGQYQFDND